MEDLVNLVEKYRQRVYCDDIEYLEHDLRGLVGLQEGLKTDFEKGLTPVDF